MSSSPRVMTADEVASRLRLPLSTVYHLAKSGKLPAFQVGRSWRFPAEAVDRLVGRQVPRARILVVDSDDRVCLSLREALLSRDCEVKEARTARTGLELAKSEQFDVLFVGLALAIQDERSLVRRLLAAYSLSQVFVVTAIEEMAQTGDLLEEGAVTLLRKPLSASQVVACVERVMGTSLGPGD